MKCRIIRAFGGYLTFAKDEVREFTEAEVIRYGHMIERVESETVNSLDGKPDKQYKKGRRK
jgi:hypothetical protein